MCVTREGAYCHDNHLCYLHRMDVLQGRSLYAMQNLLTVLPQDSLGGKDNIMGVWHSLLEFVRLGGRFLHAHTSALVGVMGVLLEKLSTYGSMVGLCTHVVCVCVVFASKNEDSKTVKKKQHSPKTFLSEVL